MTTLNNTTLASNQVTLSSKQISQVIEQLNDYDTEELVNIYNQYADAMSYERIYDNDETTLNEVFDSPYDAINRTNNFLYKDNQDYFTFNGYGHAISFDYVTNENCPIDVEELAEWISNNELYDDFDIEVTTLDDMLASIEDNITNDEDMLNKLADYLHVLRALPTKYKIDGMMELLSDYDYNQLNDIITHLNINYK